MTMRGVSRWGLAIVAVVAVIVLGVVAIGARLPVAHTATGSTTLDVPPDRVWALITDVERLAAWRSGVDSAIRVAGPREGMAWTEYTADGTLTFVVEEMEPGRRLAVRIADEGLPFGGRWTWLLLPRDGGTKLTIPSSAS